MACGRGTSLDEHLWLFAPDGTVTLRRSVVVEVGDPGCVVGRLTDGLVVATSAHHGDLGAYLAEMASLEAAAVHAFGRLGRELASLGAEGSLVARAYASAEDERRHAREVSALAARFGAHAVEREETPLPLRDARAIALENAQEGCVRETYGALVATHQAETAADPAARALFARIALDETRHAALSFDVARFLDTRLSESERVEVAHARADAIARFRAALAPTLEVEARTALGLPDEATARALYASLERTVWS